MKNKIITLLCVFGCAAEIFSQINIGGAPYGWSKSIGTAVIPEVFTPALNRTVIDQEDAQDALQNNPPRFGYPHAVNLTLTNSGVWTTLQNGDRVWQLKIKSTGALSINLLLEKYQLSAGSTLYIYNSTKTHVIGGFTSQNNKGTFNAPGKLGTGLVYGDNIILELYEPANAVNTNLLQIGTIVHGYRYIKVPGTKAFGGSGGCEVNVNCPEGNNWQTEKKGVALILVNGNRYCTGSLVNNTKADGSLYFLTANHCLGGWGNPTPKDAVTNPNAQDWSFAWEYEAPGCTNPSTDPVLKITSGATVIANNSGSDFALLKLSESPVDLGLNIYYNGWSRTTAPTGGGVGIHHPAGDLKKISKFSASPVASTYNGGSSWKADWVATVTNYGVTEGGSSGSPLFLDNKRIIGQLWGGPSYCGAPAASLNDHYGRFSVSWNSSTVPQRRLKDWLDPINSNVNDLNGANICATTLTLTGTTSGVKTFKAGRIVSTAKIDVNARVTYKASLSIALNAGFNTSTNSVFSASIVPCVNGNVVRTENVDESSYSLDNEEESTVAMVYPNPITSGILNFSKTAGSFKLINASGVEILHGTNDNQINVDGIAKGLYILHLDDQVLKVVVE